jgi:hypothetical protein
MTGPRLFMAAALLLGTGLALAVPGAALETAGAESNATSEVVTQQHASPAFANRLFHVEWSAGAAGRDQSRIFGYAYNDYRVDAVNVHLRITGLDESGHPIASIVQPVGETVRAGGRAFFDMRIPGSARSYRVTVESFDFMADGEWETQTTQQWLAAAGFDKKVADTPEKLAHLETLTPARKLVAHSRNGQLYYVYADPAVCKCLYVGTAAQYQLLLDKRLENEQLRAGQEQLEDGGILWGLWAPWPWS